jgi:hypothetical protein
VATKIVGSGTLLYGDCYFGHISLPSRSGSQGTKVNEKFDDESGKSGECSLIPRVCQAHTAWKCPASDVTGVKWHHPFQAGNKRYVE